MEEDEVAVVGVVDGDIEAIGEWLGRAAYAAGFSEKGFKGVIGRGGFRGMIFVDPFANIVGVVCNDVIQLGRAQWNTLAGVL